ncbi:hypothetical protein NDU88_007189 [Pleurodeles waltl]|uniref:Uncharacterized protein n=1 Tax=Pleurodeles waltl TaxID=8319 RepID=A0AAV7MEI3_PLEWA|nr:hypothetical protein NDU88_007189 [Pleurodeles waltl]
MTQVLKNRDAPCTRPEVLRAPDPRRKRRRPSALDPRWSRVHRTRGGAPCARPEVVPRAPDPRWCPVRQTRGGAPCARPEVVPVRQTQGGRMV